MSDQPKRHPRPDTSRLSNLMKNITTSNEKTHRPYYPKASNKSKSYQEQNQRSNDELQPVPKPLLECLEAAPLLDSKPFEKSQSQRRKKNKPFDKENLGRSNDDQVYKPEISPGKIEIGRSTLDISQPASEHLSALQIAFDKILSTRFLSEESLEQRRTIFIKLRDIVTAARPDCHVTLYGSIFFQCCLDKPGVLDIDVQLKEINQDDSLKHLLEILKNSDLYKDAVIDAENRPAFINLITNEPQMRVRITSSYHRGINISKLIRIYTKFDRRVLVILRLFRILAKVCDIDKPDIGTLHPVAFHMMVIHFLQQVEPPVLPCLHEYAYGIDNVPVTLDENQYPEFFRVCEKYSQEWKSKNKSDIQTLFLQLLSYYVKTFCVKQFVVSIQTRMPVMKIDKNWRSRKLLIEDPTNDKRNLCHTMYSIRSNDYFRDTLNTALNYFGRKQQKPKKRISNKCTIENNDEDLVEVVDVVEETDENECLKVEQSNLLHNSYKLFYKKLPPTVARDANIRQGRVREYYRNSLNTDDINLKGILRLRSNKTKFDELDENDIQNVLQQGLDENIPTNEDFEEEEEEEEQQQPLEDSIDNEIPRQDLFPTSEDEIVNEIDTNDEKTIVSSNDDQMKIEGEIKSTVSSSIDIKNNQTISPLPSPFSSPFKFQSISDQESSNENSSDYFYEFLPENFHAEQGAPYVCATCNGVGHLKHECPILILPNLITLPSIDDRWADVLSQLCRHVTDRCKPQKIDIDNREEILRQLSEKFGKDHPNCQLHAFGSFYNGFGFQKSDLDVCLVFKDEREQSSDEIIKILTKILRVMKSSNTFENVQPVLNAKVPIIRSRHRQLKIEIDVSLHNMLAIENTRLLRTYADMDSRVSQLGYMVKHLAKTCDIGDASRGTLSSYAYIIMLIHFLQQIQPPVLPVLQQMSDEPKNKNSMYKKCAQWNVYFYGDLTKIKELWKDENKLSVGALWIEFIRFYTEQFNYEEHVVTIRQKEPLSKYEKGWFRQTIAIEDPFELSHNLSGGLPPRNWMIIRRVLIRARQQFSIQPPEINISQPDMKMVEDQLFNVDVLCPENAPKRCEWCRGPYHIRKRCPALATLTNEKQRKREAENNKQQSWNLDSFSTDTTNNFQENSNWSWSSNHNYERNYPKSAPANGQRFPYPNSDRSKRFNEPRNNNSHRPQSGITCFRCGQTGHIRAKCPNRDAMERLNHHPFKSSS